ncbi:MAG: (2Fe-2S)-binding protein [Gemmatimonadota bacterium]|nr:(2Fe-2S)-binding protein [Gemmatimonadota bacterium]
MSDARERDDGPDSKQGVSRRGFLSSVGTGALSLAAARQAAAAEMPPPTEIVQAAELTQVVLQINGRQHQLLVEPRWSLAYVLRERLGLTGTKVGCERGECGACTVLIGDTPRYACMTLAVEAEGVTITTLEGLMLGEDLGPTQQAFVEEDAYQCGYCTPGQIMTVEGLVRAQPDPSLETIQVGMSGNLCRCGAYPHIFRAARRAAALRRGEGGAS